MNSSSRRKSWIIALPLAVLAALIWIVPLVIEPRALFRGPAPRATLSPTEMPPSSSALMLSDTGFCRAQPEDSAELITTVQAGAQLPVVAQYQWWYLVQVQLTTSQYNRCWINPGASTVTGEVADIPQIANPTVVPLIPAPQMSGVPKKGGQNVSASETEVIWPPLVPLHGPIRTVVGWLASLPAPRPIVMTLAATIHPPGRPGPIGPAGPSVSTLVHPTVTPSRVVKLPAPPTVLLPHPTLLLTALPHPTAWPSATPTGLLKIPSPLPPITFPAMPEATATHAVDTPVPTVRKIIKPPPPTLIIPRIVEPTLPVLKPTDTEAPPPPIIDLPPIIVKPTLPLPLPPILPPILPTQ